MGLGQRSERRSPVDMETDQLSQVLGCWTTCIGKSEEENDQSLPIIVSDGLYCGFGQPCDLHLCRSDETSGNHNIVSLERADNDWFASLLKE